jgi:phospholipid/cholesterol/gamma-HCH transport system permease protein
VTAVLAIRSWIEILFERFFQTMGELVLFFFAYCRDFFDLKAQWRGLGRTLTQMKVFGWQSLPITIFISIFTGFVVSFQTGRELQAFGIADNIGSITGISVTREMAPVITAFVIAGRIGAAMAAELGTMSVTEEVNALRSMGISPMKYLVVPRVIAGFVMMPLLIGYAMFFAFWGGALVAESLLNISQETFYSRMYNSLVIDDIAEGLVKAFVFGGIISIVSCYFGLAAREGAEAVGRAATKAVVLSLTLILMADFILARLLQEFLKLV